MERKYMIAEKQKQDRKQRKPFSREFSLLHFPFSLAIFFSIIGFTDRLCQFGKRAFLQKREHKKDHAKKKISCRCLCFCLPFYRQRRAEVFRSGISTFFILISHSHVSYKNRRGIEGKTPVSQWRGKRQQLFSEMQ